MNKQHGYLIDDVLISSEKISKFQVNITTSDDVYNAMGSPSIEIDDVDNVWIYLISVQEKKTFEEDELLFQNIYRFVFNDKNILIDSNILTEENFNKISFSTDKTTIRRDAYGITDQLYDAFTRGQ
jgi:outer membrane protein assembly factor BamE (lipoprotein component of BamABCDE complex)|tara:strand:+ start:93 stop:470 length:378 start_codon:yes stop_codon:yes gene_type:complete